MPLWMYIFGWFLLLLNTLCLIRLGILPAIFFARNYAIYNKIFWVSLFVTLVFTGSETMLIKILLAFEVN
jgi:hypothetical protein